MARGPGKPENPVLDTDSAVKYKTKTKLRGFGPWVKYAPQKLKHLLLLLNWSKT
jgi:hypothetical protein